MTARGVCRLVLWQHYDMIILLAYRRYSMSRQKNSIWIKEHSLNRKPVPLRVRSVTQTSILVGIKRLRLLWLKKKKLFYRSGCLSLLWKPMWTTATLETFTNNTTLILRNMLVFYLKNNYYFFGKNILGYPEAVSWVKRKKGTAAKVFRDGRESPWDATLDEAV